MFSKLKSAFSKFRKGSKKEPKEKVGFLKKRSEKKTSKLLDDLEEELIQNNVAVEVADKIISDLKDSKQKNIKSQLHVSIKDILTSVEPVDLLKLAKEKKKSGEPFVILFVGINGTGKTTTVAKLGHLFKKKGFSCVLAAGDTWRTGSIQQLGKHADKLGVRMVKHNYGSDPAAVAFDAVRAKGAEVVLIDTAGRQHSSDDLMDELAKIKRVAKPDFTIFTGESITGNDCVIQIRTFNEKIGVDGVILTKADVDDRGGTLLSVVYTVRKPVLFLGTGQTYDSLEPFDSNKILKRILD